MCPYQTSACGDWTLFAQSTTAWTNAVFAILVEFVVLVAVVVVVVVAIVPLPVKFVALVE